MTPDADKAHEMQTPERRREPRHKMTLPHGLTISAYGMPDMPRRLSAKVVDASENGLGIEMFVPLVAGSTVSLRGEFQGEGISMGLEGRARVAYCQAQPSGIFRIGLAFENVAYRPLAA
jgi:hypothetical protein